MVVGVGGRVGVAGWKSLDDRGWGSAAWHNLRRLSSFGLSSPSVFVRVSTLRDASGGDGGGEGGDGGGEGGAEGGGDGRMRPRCATANFGALFWREIVRCCFLFFSLPIPGLP